MREKSDIKVNIVVLNYNGRALLQECLPSVVMAAKNSKHSCSVTVIDNCSADDSVSFLEKNYKEVIIDKRMDNRVLCAFNDLLKRTRDDIAILLNSDMKVHPDFVNPLVEVFNKYEDAFLAVPKIMSFDGKKCENGKGRTMIKYGMFWSVSRYPGYEKEIDENAIISHAANGAFNRERFVSLGGFDDLYLPGIMEDADLCFSAYRKGFRCYYQPQSVVYHKGRESFKKVFEEKKIDEIAHRNTFLFMWKNIRSFRYMSEHVLFLVPRILYAVITGRFELVRGFLNALPMLPKALDKRKKIAYKGYVRSEITVFREIKDNRI